MKNKIQINLTIKQLEDLIESTFENSRMCQEAAGMSKGLTRSHFNKRALELIKLARVLDRQLAAYLNKAKGETV